MLSNEAARRPYWFIANTGGGGLKVFTIESGAGRTLPVFSFREEAELFLWLGVGGGGWTIRESRGGEILSLLSGPCAHVEKVALDPVPEVGGVALLSLVSVSRTHFVEGLLGEGEPGRGASSSLIRT